ncbi:MAG: alpha/beta hydrolase [Myxococcota bacterium]
MPLEPFRQLPFAEVPEQPRLAHDFTRTAARTIAIDTPAMGPMSIHVRTLGQGPPLLLVHGFMTTSYSWRYAIGALAERYTVYAPDLPGAGRSDKPDRSYAAENLADAIGAIMRALDIVGAPVVGNSLGGYLCMRLALREPTIMARLVNLHSPGVPTARNWALKTALALTPFAGRLVRHLVWRDPERWVHKNVHYWDESLKSREEHREYAAPLRTPEGVRAFERMLRETFEPRAMSAFLGALRRRKDRGERFPIPLQLVYAKADPMVPPSVGARLRELVPDALFVELERGSHFAHVDAPDLFLAAVRPFLEA